MQSIEEMIIDKFHNIILKHNESCIILHNKLKTQFSFHIEDFEYICSVKNGQVCFMLSSNFMLDKKFNFYINLSDPDFDINNDNYILRRIKDFVCFAKNL